jgi:hypothetical protein
MTEILYNVTLSVSEEIHDEWMSWIQEVHIPEMLKTGVFTRALLLRVHGVEQGGVTYAVQYSCKSMDDYERYKRDFAPALQAKTQSLFGDGVHPFRTLLEVIQSF